MNRLLIAATLALGVTLLSSEMNSAQAQVNFGYSYGVPTYPAVNPYCPSRSVQRSYYSNYGPSSYYYVPSNRYAVPRTSYYANPYRVTTSVTPALSPYGFGTRTSGYSYRVAPAPVNSLPRVQLRLGF
ncbi:MAG: hypothetical protein AAF483_27555 [Planctomycetota bacterium]